MIINSWLLYNYYPCKGCHLLLGCFSAFGTCRLGNEIFHNKMLHYEIKNLQLKCQQINFMCVLGRFDDSM